MKRISILAACCCLPLMAAEAPPAASPPAAAAVDAADMQPAVNTSAAATPRVSAPQKPAGGARTAPTARAQDRIELDTTQITGNRELPRVLYVVPWKRSDLGDLTGKPANSLLDEVLAPVDRDVFKRQNRYYDALKPDAAAGHTAGGAEGEK
jgi:hypothetical protein